MSVFRRAILSASFFCIFVAGYAEATDKALLIGVGDYQLENARLAGISIDIAAMRTAAVQMGFNPSNILVLEDEQATLSTIRLAVERHLIRAAEPHGRVINYFEEVGLRDEVRMMVGGAPVTQEFADEMGADGYGENAVECVETAKNLLTLLKEMKG